MTASVRIQNTHPEAVHTAFACAARFLSARALYFAFLRTHDFFRRHSRRNSLAIRTRQIAAPSHLRRSNRSDQLLSFAQNDLRFCSRGRGANEGRGLYISKIEVICRGSVVCVEVKSANRSRNEYNNRIILINRARSRGVPSANQLARSTIDTRRSIIIAVPRELAEVGTGRRDGTSRRDASERNEEEGRRRGGRGGKKLGPTDRGPAAGLPLARERRHPSLALFSFDQGETYFPPRLIHEAGPRSIAIWKTARSESRDTPCPFRRSIWSLLLSVCACVSSSTRMRRRAKFRRHPSRDPRLPVVAPFPSTESPCDYDR